MKNGRTLSELAMEIERQKEVKRDYIAPTERLEMYQVNGEIGLDMDNGGDFETMSLTPTRIFHNQVGTHTKIPRPYYQRMQETAPELLCTNVNHWFKNNPETRMIRTLDGDARAFLSDRYRPLDNFDLAQAVLPELMPQSGLEIVSCELTDTRMYIKAVNKRLEGEVKVGDPVQAGVVIRNSEVGHGALAIEPLIYRLVCSNGMISTDHRMRKFHVGSRNKGSEDLYEFLSDRTRNLTDAALWMQIRDLTKAALEEALFNQQLDKLREAAENKITGDIPKVIEITQKQFGITDEESGGILRHLIEGGDLSQWGLCNAMTAFSQEVEDYERATEFERIGGKIVELDAKNWEVIANAAA